MKAMLIDDDENRAQVQTIRQILQKCHVAVESDYAFLGMIGADDFCHRVAALTGPPDIAIIDYSLGWEDSAGKRWDGDRVATFLRDRWKDDIPFYILFVSQVLRTMSTPYEQLVNLLGVPYTGFLEFRKDWEVAFETHVRCACDLARAEKDRAINALSYEEVEAFFGTDVRGRAPSLFAVGRIAANASKSDAIVLLLGENGTGKELMARAIHGNGSRKHKPFVAVNCAAIPNELIESEFFGHKKGAFTNALADKRGLVEAAEGGTLFLDEIADMSPSMQAKLLRFLQDYKYLRVGDEVAKEANVRIIAATNKPLKSLVEGGAFRQDLYYRLNVVPVQMPALRHRREDVRELAEYFLERLRHRYDNPARTFSPAALRKLRDHSWPGNVRELENAIERAVVMCGSDIIEVDDLPDLAPTAKPTQTSGDLLEQPWVQACHSFKRSYFQRLVQDCGGNITRIAEKAGLRREHVDRVLRELDVHPRPKREPTNAN